MNKIKKETQADYIKQFIRTNGLPKAVALARTCLEGAKNEPFIPHGATAKEEQSIRKESRTTMFWWKQIYDVLNKCLPGGQQEKKEKRR